MCFYGSLLASCDRVEEVQDSLFVLLTCNVVKINMGCTVDHPQLMRWVPGFCLLQAIEHPSSFLFGRV